MRENRGPGVLNKSGLEECFEEGWVTPAPANRLKPEDSALDIEIGDSYWELGASVRPGASELVEKAVKGVAEGKKKKFTAGGEQVLETGRIYLFRAKQSLQLPAIVSGRSTGRSSVGRLDVLTRLLCDANSKFDEVPAGYRGKLYVEVIPNSFKIVVRPGMVLNQLRLFWGAPDDARLTLREAMSLADSGTVIRKPGRRGGFELFHGEELDAKSLQLSVTLKPEGNRGVAAYQARKDAKGEIDVDKNNHYRVGKYWKNIRLERGRGITLSEDHFYILASRERFYLPSTVCVECRAYQETLGEYRIHYAGFAHPWFGVLRDDRKGAPLILEVRPHSASVRLRGHEPVAQVEFYRMQHPAWQPKTKPRYSDQELTLSTCFRSPPPRPR